MIDLFLWLRQRNQTLHVAFDGGNPKKPVVVFLHGIAATSRTWEPLEHKLDYEKYRVIALDLLGFGDSPIPQDCDYDTTTHVAYVHRTLKKLHIKKPFTLVGHSMGALIAVHYTTLHPNAVSRLFLVSMPLYIRDNIDKLSAAAKAQTSFYTSAYAFFRKHPRFTIDNAQRLRNLLRLADGIDIRDENWDAFRLSLQNTIEKQHTYSEIIKLTLPIHCLTGTLDEFSVRGSIKLISEQPNVTSELVPTTDHTVSGMMAARLATLLEDASKQR